MTPNTPSLREIIKQNLDGLLVSYAKSYHRERLKEIAQVAAGDSETAGERLLDAMEAELTDQEK